MNKYTLVLLSVTAGILSGLAWTDWCPGLILLIGFVPFFIIENHLFHNRGRYSHNAFFVFILPGFVAFCLIALGWVRVATTVGALFIILTLTFLMAFTMWLAHRVRLTAGDAAGILSLIAFWLTFEYLCLNIDIFTPWLNLGNGLSKEPAVIQWYEFTGVGGGTLWILTSNICMTIFLVQWMEKRKANAGYLILWLMIIMIPSAISLSRFHVVRSSNDTEYEVVIIQPNFDPYKEKFTIPFEIQLRRVLNLIKPAATDRTCWIVSPESTVDDPVDESHTNDNRYIKMIREKLSLYPGAAFMTGMISYRDTCSPPGLQVPIAGSYGNKLLCTEHYNSAFNIDTGPEIAVYHKSKLVPGIEMQLHSFAGRLITDILPYFGGTQWGYVSQKERTCFRHNLNSFTVAPIICYESVFGRFVTDYVRKGAQALFIITNDGWWKYTNGYKQHLWYASLRAIETRRPVVRAANTGISCFIDIRGVITQSSKWWRPAIMRGVVTPETQITPYVKYGDYLMITASLGSAVIILAVFILLPSARRIKHAGSKKVI
jgi:apolipoprotein N-acyltransferase